MSEVRTGKIDEWDERRGYGYVRTGRERIFLHAREFAERHQKTGRGDLIAFEMGEDRKGRPCAKSVCTVKTGSRLSASDFLSLTVLLLLPGMAAANLPVALWKVSLVGGVISVFSWFQYCADKGRAKAGEWRISESRMLIWDLLGGWPGGFLAQKHLRHKTVKRSYQACFWGIVALYQLGALDYLNEWVLVKWAVALIAAQ